MTMSVDAPNDGLERLLVGVERRRGHEDRHPERQHRDRLHREPDVDRAPGRAEPVHLGQDVPDHVAQREQNEGAVGDDRQVADDRPERDRLGGQDVGDDH
jgi:hypothetical protein